MEMLTRANGSIVRTNEEKARMIENAAVAYAAFMKALGFDFEGDPHSSDTPNRVAKAWVNDLAEGCFSAPPKITSFENTDSYDGIVFQGDIEMVSMCLEIETTRDIARHTFQIQTEKLSDYRN